MTRILPGLPPYGPPALSFPRPDAFREGFVVEFTSTRGDVWVANFAPFGLRGLSAVYPELGPSAVLVVAGGAGFIIDADRRKLVREIRGIIEHCWYQPELNAMVISDGTYFEAFNQDQTLWQSPRASWDGMRIIDRSSMILTAEAYDPVTDRWLPLQIDLNSGNITGGSYPREMLPVGKKRSILARAYEWIAGGKFG